MKTRILPTAIAAATFALSAPTGRAAAYSIAWLDMSPTAITSPVPSGSVYNLPGYGNVMITYTSTTLNWARGNSSLTNNGSVVSVGNTYSWAGYDNTNAVNFAVDGTALDYTMLFTFQNGPVPAGRLVFGQAGLGSSSDGTNFTTLTVNQNGTFLGDYDLGANFGSTSFTGGAGTFLEKNSLSAPATGYFNTDLGVVRIDDSVSTLRVAAHHVGQDGIGMTVGWVSTVPEPGVSIMAAAAFGGLVLRRRRSRM